MQTLRTRFLFAFRTALFFCCFALLSAAPALQAQTAPAAKVPAKTAPVKTGFVNAVFKDQTGEHRYVVFVPHDYNPAKKYPVILFLHGAGERGNDGLKPTQVGLGPMIKQQEKTFPFITVFPQAENMKERLLEGWHRTASELCRSSTRSCRNIPSIRIGRF